MSPEAFGRLSHALDSASILLPASLLLVFAFDLTLAAGAVANDRDAWDEGCVETAEAAVADDGAVPVTGVCLCPDRAMPWAAPMTKMTVNTAITTDQTG